MCHWSCGKILNSPSVFSYCKRSKTEAGEGLGTRLLYAAACVFSNMPDCRYSCHTTVAHNNPWISLNCWWFYVNSVHEQSVNHIPTELPNVHVWPTSCMHTCQLWWLPCSMRTLATYTHTGLVTLACMFTSPCGLFRESSKQSIYTCSI